MTCYDISNLDKLLRGLHEPISECEAFRIINNVIYSDRNMSETRVNPEYIQVLVDEFTTNVNTINGELAIRADDERTGLIITKGKVPIIYKGRFLKDQFDNEAMISLSHSTPQINLKRLYADKVITKKYIIGRNGLYENSDDNSNFIDLVRQLENPYVTRIGLRYYYYPISNSKERILIDRNLGHRIIEEEAADGSIISQDFAFDPKELSISNLQLKGSSLPANKIYNDVYLLTPLNPPIMIRDSIGKPKVYQKY